MKGRVMMARVVWQVGRVFFFSGRRRHTRYIGDWSSDVCSSDLLRVVFDIMATYLIAAGATRPVLVVQALWIAVLAPAMAAGIEWYGLAGAGWAHVAVRSEERRGGGAGSSAGRTCSFLGSVIHGC